MIFMFKINQNTGCITLNCFNVTFIVTIHTYNVSIVRIKVARSTIGSSEAVIPIVEGGVWTCQMLFDSIE
jgi:hypothetical protein